MNRNAMNIFFIVILLLFLSTGCTTTKESHFRQQSKEGLAKSLPGADIAYIDAHNHISGGQGFRPDFSGAVYSALATMKELGIGKIIIMPPPFSPAHRGIFDSDALLPFAAEHPDRIAVLGGGGTLNVMIHGEGKSNSVSPEMKAVFEKKAAEIISKGAVGLGEFAVEHFSFTHDHPYESVSADHPLFLLLADIAAKHDVPVDIHMEAIPKDMPLPYRPLLKRSGNNPKMLRENMSGFERLLSHNPKAKIIWAHAGWCNTGFRTPELCRDLFNKYPNLYMSFKFSPDSVPETRPVSEDNNSIKPEWLKLIKDFPDRFIIGTDQFYVPPGSRSIGPQKTEGSKRFISLLPPDLARRIGVENPKRIFNLKD